LALPSLNATRGSTHVSDVLRVATIFGAEAIGLDQDLGSLEPGRLANLVMLDRNPLTEVFPRGRPLPLPWWYDAEPVDLPGRGR
jgi:imidazolonepropionase-like amidohydrolase